MGHGCQQSSRFPKACRGREGLKRVGGLEQTFKGKGGRHTYDSEVVQGVQGPVATCLDVAGQGGIRGCPGMTILLTSTPLHPKSRSGE